MDVVTAKSGNIVLIETLWNVKEVHTQGANGTLLVLIETLWNVKADVYGISAMHGYKY